MIPVLLGVDFGTASVRAVLINAEDGRLVASGVSAYAHGTYTPTRPLLDRIPLPTYWALQNAQDYLEALEKSIQACLTGVEEAVEVLGIGVDFTSCTILPTDEYLRPLHTLSEFVERPHAYVKLWKHHAAGPQARLLNNLPLPYGKTSSEWVFAKALELFQQDPLLYDRAARWIEAGDWVVSHLVGQEVRSLCQAGYKAHWRGAYPDAALLEKAASGFSSILEKLMEPRIGSKLAGYLTKSWAEKLRLPSGIPVATALIDCHTSTYPLRGFEPGVLVSNLGTSACHLSTLPSPTNLPGMIGGVEDGVADGYWTAEFGQPALGDAFSWLSRLTGISLSELEEEARREPPHPALAALDWWNGSRTPLQDESLRAIVWGLDLDVSRGQLYRAMLEAAACGIRQITQAHSEVGAPLERIRTAGGIAERGGLLLEIISKVTGLPIEVSKQPFVSARGAAMHAGVAAGLFAHGREAAEELGDKDFEVIKVDDAVDERLEKLYIAYKQLHQRSEIIEWLGYGLE